MASWGLSHVHPLAADEPREMLQSGYDLTAETGIVKKKAEKKKITSKLRIWLWES
jgi:hypothetical protein